MGHQPRSEHAQTPGGEPVLEVTRAGEAMPVRVGPPLSRGTLEQIYVAVRLALVDAIDAEARLPMFLDELFAHWDAHRLDALVRVLGAVEGRQVVVSTCHAALADRLERACGARVIELAGPDGCKSSSGRPRRLAVATAAPEQEGPTLLDLLELYASGKRAGLDPRRPLLGAEAAGHLRFLRGSDRRASDDRHRLL